MSWVWLIINGLNYTVVDGDTLHTREIPYELCIVASVSEVLGKHVVANSFV
jgi:hypothetical protein